MKNFLRLILVASTFGIYSMQIEQESGKISINNPSHKATKSLPISEESIKENIWVNYTTAPERELIPICFTAGSKEEFFSPSLDKAQHDCYIVITELKGISCSWSSKRYHRLIALVTFFNNNPFDATSFKRASSWGTQVTCVMLNESLVNNIAAKLPTINKDAPMSFNLTFNEVLQCYQGLLLIPSKIEEQNLLSPKGFNFLSSICFSEIHKAYKKSKENILLKSK